MTIGCRVCVRTSTDNSVFVDGVVSRISGWPPQFGKNNRIIGKLKVYIFLNRESQFIISRLFYSCDSATRAARLHSCQTEPSALVTTLVGRAEGNRGNLFCPP